MEHSIIENIEKIVSGLSRDDTQLSIDVSGALVKLFYQVADEEEIDNILENTPKGKK